MKILEFNYKKTEESVSKTRLLLALKEPFPDYEGYDLSELSEEDYAELVYHLKLIQEDFSNLLSSFDLRKSYRRFKPEKMTTLVSVDL